MIWRDWLPVPQQMSDAVQLRRNAYTNISMQQALGMIVLLGLLAGLLPFISNWVWAARMNTALPFAQLAQASVQLRDSLPAIFIGLPGISPILVSELFPTIAGLPQPLPGWAAGGLSALGEWINWPLQWLSIWIVYGAFVMVVNKALGATPTLQHFYAATGYAAVPLLLTGLSPIPCLGWLAVILGTIWAVAVYVRANQDVTGFPPAKAATAVFLPAGILLLLLFALLALLAFSLIFALV
ncbi:MAG: hypothetical protein KF893_02705 [Caldilineaceae bacterium]|nr:hypothetical protein [Caldilineaceae bacterium]